MSATPASRILIAEPARCREQAVVPRPEAGASWYAAYTCARHEKHVAEQLARREVEHFLPLYTTVHRWKDRRKRLELPLFPGYIFVRMPLCERLRVLELPSVVRLVGFHGQPEPLPEGEIESLRAGLRERHGAMPYPYLASGRRVRIIAGALAGREGILVRRKPACRVVLSIHLIQRSIALELDLADIEPLPVPFRITSNKEQDSHVE